jgi:phage baseplate assembly protein W
MTVTATFPLLVDPPETQPAPSTGFGTLADLDDRTSGMGLITPINRSNITDFAAGAGIEAVRSAVGQVIGTRADDGRMTGELPWRTDFGSIVHRMMYLGADESFASLLRSRIVSALALWEPRARVRSLSVLRVITPENSIAVVARLVFDVVQGGTSTILASNQQLDIPLGS